MSKKKVISDFGDLKGKISFSDREDCATSPMEPIVQQRKTSTESSDDSLHVGQSVVLMDSDLRGKIIKLGKTVTIELEDGLMIEAGYGDFAVTSDAEISELKSVRAKTGKKSDREYGKSRKPAISPDRTLAIDLHIDAIPGGRSVPQGQHLLFQMETFRRALQQNLRHKGMKIKFIHGIGDGTLKSAIRKELDEVYALRCSYSIGDPAVTIVTII